MTRAPLPAGASLPTPPGPRRGPWLGWVGLLAIVGFTASLYVSDSATYRGVLRFYQDRELLRLAVQQSGALGPVLFMGVQALQVLISPVPGEVTGFLGGYLFGEGLGFLYSTLGLTLGSLIGFAVGRSLGAPFLERLIGPHLFGRVGFLVKAEGLILCFVVFLLPGIPKDLACYLFGLSPIPFGAFALVSTLGRMPSTWALSAQGAKTAAGQYLELALLVAVLASVAVPLYYYRDRLLRRFRRRGASSSTPRSGQPVTWSEGDGAE